MRAPLYLLILILYFIQSKSLYFFCSSLVFLLFTLLMLWQNQAFGPAHIWTQSFWNINATICLLMVFQQWD
ncbi:hypothetical protein D3C74_458250 [compost metagenome]